MDFKSFLIAFVVGMFVSYITSLIRTESVALLLLTVLSLVRLVNRIERTPEILNIIITLLVLAGGTACILVAIMRIYQNRRK